MTPFFKVLASIFFVAIGVASAIIGFRGLKLTASKLSILRKIGKSIKVGLLFTICIFSFMGAIFIWFWSDYLLEIGTQTIFSILVCVLIPCWIVITTGVFVQINYLEFLIHYGRKE